MWPSATGTPSASLPSKAPVWLSRLVVEALHFDQIREHGGLAGLRDEGALEAALARPRHKHAYNAAVDLPTLAAAYAFGLVTNHPFRDGNKRIAFLAMAVFLELNGMVCTATEEAVVETMVAAAAGTLTERRLVTWVRRHSRQVT